ncbi:pyridoxamine 5'-phosphate oxidase family protein [Streptomyces sp. Z26]|uniref:pyridoxamine 5'-phosphate oxidase family protein n=1 Tax=Streptomyces sp. Z26 TaxID=2500177 RepID=UPI000F21E57C|nr:pyridoxamine 5'-phosphate oxidase family protein [Streptomyces sp. Z26]RLL67630.1 hypothetical protein D7M15_13105 [Streptomyces sp. Z26]
MSTDLPRSRPQWHAGEEAMHRLLRVPYEDNPTTRGLPAVYGSTLPHFPLFALGAVDRHDRVWTTLFGGRPGTAGLVSSGVLGLAFPARLRRLPVEEGGGWVGPDPVLEALVSGTPSSDGQPIDLSGKTVSGLALDLETRTRVKVAGRAIRGAVLEKQPAGGTVPAGGTEPVDVRLAVAVEESLGNCPKYLNRKRIWPHDGPSGSTSDFLPLPPDAVELVGRSDILFISSRHGGESMDTNNRGGAPGFARILRNSDEGVALVYPEYSGNRLFQTLGNLKSDPAVGITFPDFESGDVLYVTGRAEVLVGADAAALLPHTKLAVRVTVEAARFVRAGLPFRGKSYDQSPYNPPVRKLACETDGSDPAVAGGTDAEGNPVGVANATLIRGTRVTPTISRYTFRLTPDPSSSSAREKFAQLRPWRAGQYVTFDFSAALDRGWSHMRDHDPGSLNDDYVRSFTISSPPAPPAPRTTHGSEPQGPLYGAEFDITVRRHGPVTKLLARWTPGTTLEAAVLGFGGEEDASYVGAANADPDAELVVVVAGVGVTPLLAQVRAVWRSGLKLSVLWSLSAEDLPLAVDTLKRHDGLGAATNLFVTRVPASGHETQIQTLVRIGAHVHTRRIEKADFLSQGAAGRRRFHVCTGPGLRNSILEWAAGEDVRFESFNH